MEGFYRDFMTHDRVAALAAFDGIPTRVLVGDRDVLTPVAHARTIATSISTARLAIAPGAGHMLPLERDRLVSDELVELVTAALATDRSVPPSPRPREFPSEGRRLPAAHQHHSIHHADVVDGNPDLGVLEAAPGAQVESVPVHRRGHEPHVTPSADDPPGQERRPRERVVVAERMDFVVVGKEQRDRLAMDQCGRATFGLQLLQPAHRLPLLVARLTGHLRLRRFRPIAPRVTPVSRDGVR